MNTSKKFHVKDLHDVSIDHESQVVTLNFFDFDFPISFNYLDEYIGEDISDFKESDHDHSFDGGLSHTDVNYELLIEACFNDYKDWIKLANTVRSEIISEGIRKHA